MDWALEQARGKRAVISGFHSPLEQSVLKVLTAAGSTVVVVLARPLSGAKLPPEWTGPLAQQLATQRNALVAQLAHKIVVAHASPAGSLAAQLDQWRLDGRQVELL